MTIFSSSIIISSAPMEINEVPLHTQQAKFSHRGTWRCWRNGEFGALSLLVGRQGGADTVESVLFSSKVEHRLQWPW
jgi:hypothetical protein